jgi:hypothetical protein
LQQGFGLGVVRGDWRIFVHPLPVPLRVGARAGHQQHPSRWLARRGERRQQIAPARLVHAPIGRRVGGIRRRAEHHLVYRRQGRHRGGQIDGQWLDTDGQPTRPAAQAKHPLARRHQQARHALAKIAAAGDQHRR